MVGWCKQLTAALDRHLSAVSAFPLWSVHSRPGFAFFPTALNLDCLLCLSSSLISPPEVEEPSTILVMWLGSEGTWEEESLPAPHIATVVW